MEMNPKGSGDRNEEMQVFILLAVFLAPVSSIALVGGYGLVIWIMQMFFGPPGPPV